ncbi:putative membrane protein [Spathaspora sp. JA1]|nr:putative membrane protein [Spathaspora sp. JA1]
MSIPESTTKVYIKTAPNNSINFEFNQPDSTFEIKQTSLGSELKEGEILVETLYLSNDPTQRGWINPKLDTSRSYMPPVLPGSPMQSMGIAKVLKSNSEKYKVGDVVTGKIEWATHSILDETRMFNKIDVSAGLPLELYLSILGVTGLTAYFGLIEAGGLRKILENPVKEGEKVPIVCISAASGATGSVAVQIAKNILGAKVIGITGSDEKCKYVESIGADLGVNYNDPKYKEKISEFVGTDFIDVYFDNVGGEILSFVLTRMKRFGRVIACGAISGYNTPVNVTTWNEIITMSLTVEGFIVLNYLPKFPEAVNALAGALKSGKIKLNDAYHVKELSGTDAEKLEQVPQIWNLLFTDKPVGKLLTKFT